MDQKQIQDAANERLELIKSIERQRRSKVICYLTSLRPNVPAGIGGDAVRVFFDHLLGMPKRKISQLDLFLCSNGGDGTAPWRLISLFREFADQVCVLIPYRAMSAASLIALGADEIVMHPFAEMGPIDPSVQNDFNPVESNTNRRLPISVEDVKAYISFVKQTFGITHEDELVKALEILANKVHPLALGNVERFLAQSRMIAAKILRTHMKNADQHQIDEIVESMASKLYFHGHPINRVEAREELKLKVSADASSKLEDDMWRLYELYEKWLLNTEPFNLDLELTGKLNQPGDRHLLEQTIAVIESAARTSAYVQRRQYVFQSINPANQQPNLAIEPLKEGWEHLLVRPRSARKSQ